MASTVYIETTIPSAYVTGRSDPGSRHRKAVTRDWWEKQLAKYEPWTSDVVLLELGQGNWQGKSDAVQLMESIKRLDIDEEVIAVARRYIEDQLVPRDIPGDAVHLAVACV